MVYIAPILTNFRSEKTTLTAPLAISLAEGALKAGRLEAATRYVNIAYAIFDAQVEARRGSP